MAPVLCTASPLNQTFDRQLVDQENHSAWENAEKFGQTLLIQARRSGDESENAGMGGRDAKVGDSVRKSPGGMRAELRQEECSSSWSVFGRTHAVSNLENRLQSAIIHNMNDS